jgi:hypothetical protein
MAATYKVLGQVNPAATTLTTLYTAPAGAVVSTLSVCNQGATTTFRVLVSVAGAALNAKQYVVYDTGVDAKDTVFLTLGMTLAATDIVKVYAGTANVSFNLFGSEVG